MSIVCPVDLDTVFLRGEVANIYARVATDPNGTFHFHRGPRYASEFLGYDPDELSALPSESTASFAGVGNPLAIAPIQAGETVLDIGCGAGMDLLLAASRVGSDGQAIGVDMTEAMAERARSSATALGYRHVEVRIGDATTLPVGDASVDVVISNGVLNLVPEKERAFAEILRVLRPGGRLQLADIVVEKELSDDSRRNVDLWTG
ncbi:MAG: methyltransferase domain-containing protein [Acidobacteria bacterium]|nr:methyltransferase domain-containing protein [Acidobacteriota bacterium]